VERFLFYKAINGVVHVWFKKIFRKSERYPFQTLPALTVPQPALKTISHDALTDNNF